MQNVSRKGVPGALFLVRVVHAFTLSLSLFLVYATAALAGEFDYLTEHPGKFSATVTTDNHPVKKLSKADAAAYKRNLARLRDLLAKQPVFTPPRGVEVKGYFRPNDDLPATTKVPVPGFGYLRFHFYFVNKKTGKPVHICCTTDEMYVSVNDPGKGFDSFGTSGYPSRAMYEPIKVGEVAGFPLYRMDNGDEVLVMKRGNVEPWIPLTREEYIAADMKMWQKQAAETSLDTLSPQIAQNHQAALDAMTQQERKLQARYHPWDPFQPTLAPIGSDEGRPLVRVNPAWFDPSLPRSAFQLVTIRFCYTGNGTPTGPTEFGDISPYRVWQALHTSDWAEIGAVVKEK